MNAVTVVAVGTAAWLVAFLAVLLARDELAPDHRYWLWTCLAGLVLGGFGLGIVYAQRRGARHGGSGNTDRRPPAG